MWAYLQTGVLEGAYGEMGLFKITQIINWQIIYYLQNFYFAVILRSDSEDTHEPDFSFDCQKYVASYHNKATVHCRLRLCGTLRTMD